MKTFEEIKREHKFIEHLSEPIKEVILEYFGEDNWNITNGVAIINTFGLQKETEITKLLNCFDEHNFNYYNGYACNDKERLVFSYEEGDVFLAICDNEESYQREKDETIEELKTSLE
ncbi:MAG: hypothetical protein RR084_08480 [Bacteroidales bacterium]